MRHLLKTAILGFFAAIILCVGLWGSLALWYRFPSPDFAKAAAGAAFGTTASLSAISMFTRWRLLVCTGFSALFASVLIWWSQLAPPSAGDWSPDVSMQVRGIVDGDALTLKGVRDFDWRSDNDYVERWATRTYDLAKLRTVDMFASYWDGPYVAHVIVSFGFEGGDYLAWSVEVRRRKGAEFSPLADLFKSNPLVIIAATERDVIGVRSNIRGEDVQLYRLNVSPEGARRLLLQYVADANSLDVTPQFFNSLTSNCVTTAVGIARATGYGIPVDWRIVFNGYLSAYAYERGLLDSRLTLSALKASSHINQRAVAAGSSPDFSAKIRQGVPSPLQ